MRTTIQFVLAMIREAFLIRTALHLENLALRQQLAALKRDKARPSLRMDDRLFRIFLAHLWPGWREVLVRLCQINWRDLADQKRTPLSHS